MTAGKPATTRRVQKSILAKEGGGGGGTSNKHKPQKSRDLKLVVSNVVGFSGTSEIYGENVFLFCDKYSGDESQLTFLNNF